MGITFRLILLVLGVAYMSGCSMTTVQYQPDFNLVNDTKDNDLPPLAVGEFSEAAPALNRVSIRGSTMVSNFDKSFGAYLRNALEEQLKQADLWRESSDIVVSGTLTKNDFDASGFNIGTADLAAEFMVTRQGAEVYRKEHVIHHEWDSSFVGAIAIPNAQNNYPIAVQKLIGQFLTDPEFLAVLQ